jgi:hypothetical protein
VAKGPAKKVAPGKTAPLPKATVKLQAAPSLPKAPTLSGVTASSVIDDDDDGGLITPIAILAFIVCLVLLAIELMTFLQA